MTVAVVRMTWPDVVETALRACLRASTDIEVLAALVVLPSSTVTS